MCDTERRAASEADGTADSFSRVSSQQSSRVVQEHVEAVGLSAPLWWLFQHAGLSDEVCVSSHTDRDIRG